MLSKEEIKNHLEGFCGTEQYHRLSPLHGKLVCTDGIAWLAENAGCHWLIDLIASYQPKCQQDDMLRYMQFWTIKVKDSKARISCERDSGNLAFSKSIKWTDFPLDEQRIWVEAGCGYMVAMLPGER